MAADLQYTMGLDARQFAAGANAAKGATGGVKGGLSGLSALGANFAATLTGLGGSLMKFKGPLIGVGVSIYGLKKAWEAFTYAAGKGDALNELADRLGVTNAEAMRLTEAFRNAGKDTGLITTSVNIMQKALSGVSESGEPTNKMFEQLGLNSDELKAKSPAAALQQIGEAISAIENPTARVNAAMRIFGRSGSELLGVFNKPEAMAAFTGELGRQQKLLVANADRFEKNSINLKKMGENAKGAFGFKMGFASEFKGFDAVVEKLGQLDWSAIGQTIGKNLNDMIRLAFLWKNLLKLGFLEAYNLGLQLFQKVGLFKGAAPFDTAELEGKIEGLKAAIGGPIKEPGAAGAEAGGAQGGGENPARKAGGASVKIATDRITQVGGFVGGDFGRTQDPVVALEKKVEENTRKIYLVSQQSLKAFLDMQNRLLTMGAGPGASVFAQ